jgi:hypothetical protein
MGSSTESIDVLPLLLTQALNPSLAYQFEETKTPTRWHNAELAQEEVTLFNFLLHYFKEHETWRFDLLSGRFASIVILRGMWVRMNFVRGREPPHYKDWLSITDGYGSYERGCDDAEEMWGFEYEVFRLEFELELKFGIVD